MTRFTRRALATATALTLLSTGASAFAAEAAPETGTEIAPVTEAAPAAGTIAVQLNGQDLAFTDAAPQAKDGRTFLPFRAVFEAMGAEVSYDAAANQVSATRGGTTVAMTLGSTEATVTAGGVTTPLTMDVAPYAADNRTYVPVRFAAQAFGCAVGWDQDDSTVILVDTAKLLEEAKAGHTYTYLDKYLAYNEQFTTGNWAMDANFNASVGLLGMGPATVAGTMTGVTAGATQMEAAMNMKLDLQALLEGIAAMTDTASEVDAETAARCRDAYRERFRTVGLFENRLFPEIPALLRALTDQGYILCTATSKPEDFATRILDHFGLSKFFSLISGATMDGQISTKVQVIEHTLARLGQPDRAHAIMIGDRRHDIQGAHAAGLRAIGVLYGYGSLAELQAAGADAIAPEITDLPRAISHFFQ